MKQTDKVVFSDYEIGNLLCSFIDAAKREIIIVSPYVKFWHHLTQAIERAKRKGVKLTLYYREDYADKLDHTETRRLFDNHFPVPQLHAKLYFFDDEVIISSMNLLESSAKGSMEIAVHLIEPRQIEELRAYLADRIMPAVHKLKKQASVKPKAKRFAKKSSQGRKTSITGYCIRCGNQIKRNPERPFCLPCFKKWEQYLNPDYEENFCHSCGTPAETSFDKPRCYSCYKAEG